MKNLQTGKGVYLCNSADEVDENVIQFYGEAVGAAIRPGMILYAPNGSQYVIKEVYADEEIMDRQSTHIPEGMKDTALVIETSAWDWGSFHNALRADGVVALKVA